MRLEQEGRDYAEVTAAATKRPKQVAILLGIRGDEPAVGQYDVGAEQIIDGQAALAGEMAQAAAERQSADAGARNNPSGNGQAEGMRGVIHIAPDASAADTNRTSCRIHMNVLDAGEVDGQGIVGDAEAAGIVPATADGDPQSAGSSEFHRRDHIGHVHALDDEPRLLVDHRVVDFPGVLVGAAAWFNQFAAKLRAELGDFFLGDHETVIVLLFGLRVPC